MNTDDVIDYRRLLNQFDLTVPEVPQPTIYATDEWVDAVWQMTHQIPIEDDGLVWPSHKDTAWAWADTGVLVIFETTQVMEHVIVTDGADYTPIEPEIDRQDTVAMLFSIEALHRVHRIDVDLKVHNDAPMPATTVVYLSPLTTDNGRTCIPLSTAHIVQNHTVKANRVLGFAQSTRFLYAMTWAMGHKMTTHTPMGYANHPQRKRYRRSGLPPVRMLELTAPTAEETGGTKVVNWKHSWQVRTHWRNQACGPKMRQHKKILIHSYWKQDHLPPDLRPTVWRTET